MTVGPLRRISYSLTGLVAGNTFLLLWSLGNALRMREALLRIHRGAPGDQIPLAFQFGLIYFVFSVGEWALLGIPLVLAIPARIIARMSGWILLLGLFSGPISLVLVFLLLPNSHLNLDRWRDGILYVIFAAIIASIASAVYCALIRRRLAKQPREIPAK